MKRFFLQIAKAVAISLILSSCAGASEEPSSESAEWIKAYSGGILEEGETVKVIMTAPSASGLAEQLDDKDLNRLFSFSPRMRGEVRISGNDMVEFIPDEGEMKPGTHYKASFRLGDVIPAGKGPETFRFSFMSAVRALTLDIDGVTITESSPEKAAITGRIMFSCPTDAETARGLISCECPGQRPEMTVTDGKDGKTATFRIEGLERKADDFQVRISAGGKGSGYGREETVKVTVPGTEGFRVMSANLVRDASPHVNVSFSQPLAGGDDPEGMFVLENAGRSYTTIRNNQATIYFENENADREMSLRIAGGVRSASGERLGEDFIMTLTDDRPKPAVEILLKGNILPDGSELILPFRAVCLRAVDVSVIRIFGNNVLTFLQDNDLDGESGLRRSGRLVCRKTVRLDADPTVDLNRWNEFAVDLSGLFRQEPGAIYRVRLSFRSDYSLFGTPDGGTAGNGGLVTMPDAEQAAKDELVWDTPSPYYYEDFTDWEKYDWKERDNPLDPTYYMMEERFPVCNLMASGLGVSVKASDGNRLWIAVTDVMEARPVKDAEITIWNYQLQEIGKGRTGRDGFAEVETDGKAFAVTVSKGKSVSHLKVTDGAEKPMSRFDVGGKKTEKGIKAFIYGERGVWRPGDTLNLTLIAEDRQKSLPDGHPVTLELYTPQGQFHTRLMDTEGRDGFHVFRVPTSETDPTGTWNACFKIGGATFHKALIIETIKPNRLKISFSTSDEILRGGKKTGISMKSSWLTGPAAAGLNGKMEMTLSPAGASFDGYEGYVFRDPTSTFSSSAIPLFEARLDSRGTASAQVAMPDPDGAPGMLQARIVARVEEGGGDESIVSATRLFSPYDAYVGIKMPAGENGYLETDTDHSFAAVVADAEGTPVKGHRIEYRIYRLDWSWWWESGAEKLDSYVNGTATEPFISGSFTSDGKPHMIPFRLDYPDWGRFLIYVKDMDSGHASGGIFTADWPAYRGRSDKRDPSAVTMLTFSTDKKEYAVGETATVFIPAAKDGLALVSLENGSRVLSRAWVKTSGEGDTPFRFTVTEEMSPNLYVYIALLQKHGNTDNDLPLRMYGVQPVSVSDGGSHLNPEIIMPDSVRPLEEFSIRVREKDGKKMTYTLAIVDEGLLDLTAFKTPDPWSEMYAKEALGIKTWDLYDDFVGAFGGRFSPLAAIGGDQTVSRDAKQDNRFNPVVKFLGPFTLNGREIVHKVTLPMYVGSVRVMLVAGRDGAYGNAEKTVPVKTPLMVLPTLPRTLSQGDVTVLPVNVFAMEEGVRDVTVSVSAEGAAKIDGAKTQSIKFTAPGDSLVRFRLIASPDSEGTAKVTVKAEGAGYVAEETVSVPVRNPNPVVTDLQRSMIGAGDSRTFSWTPFKADGENSAALEIAGFPALDFNSCFDFAARYAHSCTEQISARGMTVLAILDQLSEENGRNAEKLVPQLLDELYGRQLPDGGFTCWPGGASADEWVSSMAGHFMTLARNRGYEVNDGVFAAWRNFQRRCVRNWRETTDRGLSDLVQAYRLYTLALASSPETGAMNRLKESGMTSVQARWRLAAAYALSGKKETAKEMVAGLKTEVAPYGFSTATYGSPMRDKAMILETLALIGDMGGALPLAEELSEAAASSGWFTTQTAAFTAVAMGRLAGMIGTGVIEAEITEAGDSGPVQVREAAAVCRVEPDATAGGVTVKNLSEGVLYAVLSTRIRPEAGVRTEASSSGLDVAVSWSDLEGSPISPDNLRQGTDFLAAVSVSNISGTSDCRSLALTFTLPSGWEIFNERLISAASMVPGAHETAASDPYISMDIRDDRVMIYFDLDKGTKKTFTLRLRAAYEGTYLLPSISCEQMYDPSVNARTASESVKVTR